MEQIICNEFGNQEKNSDGVENYMNFVHDSETNSVDESETIAEENSDNIEDLGEAEKDIDNNNDDTNVVSEKQSSEDELESSRQSQCEELFVDDEDNIDSDEDLKYESLLDLQSNSGKKVIVPTMDIPDHDSLQLEIQQDSREAELLIQLKHLSARIEAQDTLIAELKEENTVLKIQNQNLVDSLNKVSNKNNLFRKSSKEYQSLEPQELDESTERKKLFLLEQELEDQKEVNKQLKAYVGDVLINIIVQNPDILEKKSQQ